MPEWNRAEGAHRARTKHGNYNAWLAAHGDDYDFFASVDTDHVPLPELPGADDRATSATRTSPSSSARRCTGTTTHPSPRPPSRQQFLFHALIQRAGNRYGAPMFVGTNNVVRIAALRQIGGLYDSITEDMATGFELHRRRNPRDRAVLAVRLHPGRARRRRGARLLDRLLHPAAALVARHVRDAASSSTGRRPSRMPPGRLLNYTLMLVYYPMTARQLAARRLSAASLFLWFGRLRHPGRRRRLADALQRRRRPPDRAVPVEPAAQRLPHEPEGSGGLAGMAMSALSAPIYLKSLGAALLRRRSRFVVTPKGDDASPDRLLTFRVHLCWAALLAVSLVASVLLGHTHAAMRTWAVLALAISLAPVGVWIATRARGRAVTEEPVVATTTVSPAAGTPTGGT